MSSFRFNVHAETGAGHTTFVKEQRPGRYHSDCYEHPQVYPESETLAKRNINLLSRRSELFLSFIACHKYISFDKLHFIPAVSLLYSHQPISMLDEYPELLYGASACSSLITVSGNMYVALKRSTALTLRRRINYLKFGGN